MYKLHKESGIPALLNASFNLHGFSIVNSIYDEEKIFSNSELEILWLQNHIIEKSKMTNKIYIRRSVY